MSSRTFHIVQRLAPGGLEVLVLELARQLPGHHTIVSLEGDTSHLQGAWPRLAKSGVETVALGKRPGLDWRLISRLVELFGRHEKRTVITHHIGPLLYAGAATRLAVGTSSLIHVEHDVWHYRAARRRILMRAAETLTKPKVVAVSERIRSRLHLLFSVDARTIANGVDLVKFRPERERARGRLGVTPGDRVIGVVGRLEFVKGHDVLIDALASLPPRTLLFIIGDGTRMESLRARAERLGVHDRVRFLGHRDDVAELYPAFDVYCQPSRAEGLPIAILEAQACGVPVVASSVGDMPEAVCRACGRLTPPEDPDLLARALSAVLTTPATVSPREFIRARYDWARTLAGYAQMIEVESVA